LKKYYKSTDIPKLKDRAFFFDANIFLYLFWATGKQSFENQYASIFGQLLKQKNAIYVDFIVISEIINRAFKTEYEKILQSQNLSKDKLPYKKFRDSQEGKDALEDIYSIVKNKIINKFNMSGKAFSKKDIESFLYYNTIDFNDKGIVSICMENNFILLTNDKDFINSDLEILSANPVFKIP